MQKRDTFPVSFLRVVDISQAGSSSNVLDMRLQSFYRNDRRPEGVVGPAKAQRDHALVAMLFAVRRKIRTSVPPS